MFRSYVINLDRQPERFASFNRWNRDCGLSVERFAACDGATLDEAARSAAAAPNAAYTPNAVACGISHRMLWERAAEDDRPTVVFEDDAVIRADAGTVLPRLMVEMFRLKRWDILLLGFNTDSVLGLMPGERLAGPMRFIPHPSPDELERFQTERSPVRPLRLAAALGTCGYVISPRGARALLKLCFPMDDRVVELPGHGRIKAFGIDSMLNAFFASIAAYICLPPLVMTPNVNSGTAARP